ncbi:MAG: universal stress protein [Candidatus Bipolaricaulia bacterium]
MLPFKRILCPTDFSEPSHAGIKAAVEMAERFSAELILMHVVGSIPALDTPEGIPSFDVAAYQRELTGSAERCLEERQAKVPESVPTRTLVTHGEAGHEIVRVAEEEGVDLIVMATHGATGWRHKIFGTVAEKVVRTAHCSVLTTYYHPPD